MKLNDKKFGKIFAEPNRTCQNQPNPEPNRNFGRFLLLVMGVLLFLISSSNIINKGIKSDTSLTTEVVFVIV